MLELVKVAKVGVILRPSSPDLKEIFESISGIFATHDIEVKLDSISAAMIGLRGVEFATLVEWSDILLSIGGDGTLIAMVRRCYG